MPPLAPHEFHLLAIDPRLRFVPTGLVVAPGERYRFTASGLWRDWFRTVDADGWSCPPLHYLNRLPGIDFFRLCGCVGTDETQAFAIGKSLDWTVPDHVAAQADRQLNLFANDWRCMFFNNRELPVAAGGPLSVEILRLA